MTDELITAFNAADFERAATYFAPQATYVCPGGIAEGRAEIASFFALYHEGFPDLVVTPHGGAVCGDLVVLEWIVTSTHTGPFLLPSGEIVPPTGRRVAVRGCDVRTMEDGLISSQRVYYDQLEMLSQLGVPCPSP
ncbi:ester cyclase [Sphaerisporangium aureirubrum]|uniref:Ester cyclase n=1 Tax=Sphaerisporangium aureirubrum TaxID=1544736 RepID=A0ABW1NJ71_9ACTN